MASRKDCIPGAEDAFDCMWYCVVEAVGGYLLPLLVLGLQFDCLVGSCGCLCGLLWCELREAGDGLHLGDSVVLWLRCGLLLSFKQELVLEWWWC